MSGVHTASGPLSPVRDCVSLRVNPGVDKVLVLALVLGVLAQVLALGVLALRVQVLVLTVLSHSFGSTR